MRNRGSEGARERGSARTKEQEGKGKRERARQKERDKVSHKESMRAYLHARERGREREIDAA